MSSVLSAESASLLSTCSFELQTRIKDIRAVKLDFSGSDPEDAIIGVCDDGLGVLGEGGYRPRRAAPSTDIAKMIIRLANHANHIPPLEELDPEDVRPEGEFVAELNMIGCLEAEPRLIHSLGKRRKRQPETYRAAILFDTEEEPIAYQKGNGIPLAFTWRDGYINTSEGGALWVPENAIIRPLYESGHNPRTMDVDESLLAIRNPHIRAAHFLRFTTVSWLPTALAEQAAEVASARATEPHIEDAQEAARLTAHTLQERIIPLLSMAHFLDA